MMRNGELTKWRVWDSQEDFEDTTIDEDESRDEINLENMEQGISFEDVVSHVAAVFLQNSRTRCQILTCKEEDGVLGKFQHSHILPYTRIYYGPQPTTMYSVASKTNGMGPFESDEYLNETIYNLPLYTLSTHSTSLKNGTYSNCIIDFDEGDYSMTLDYNYLGRNVQNLQLRIYSQTPLYNWLPYSD
ncbi:hypothetical protein L5515_006601 [Caenorhabditis briggsae]|uniref:DUF7154 domain-containing protein n=1 Tax=Caenorhabditis briggsae TaxID=6238 RepID=A0AAE9F0W8_CAEBR|nr:hypothetical protein L5515_006601 [Caenorhabditis briggsae]